MLVVKQIKKSRNYGERDADDVLRYGVVCYFAPVSNKSRFAQASYGANDLYQHGLDLQDYFPQNKPSGDAWSDYDPAPYWRYDARNKVNVFNEEKAYSDFTDSMLNAETDDFVAYAFDMPEISDYRGFDTSEGNIWETYRIAEFSDTTREIALRNARRSIARMLERGIIEPHDYSNEKKNA